MCKLIKCKTIVRVARVLEGFVLQVGAYSISSVKLMHLRVV